MRTLTEQIGLWVQELISSGEVGPDGKLPSERQLAERFDAGRTTVRLALVQLKAQGVVRTEPGRGYYAVEGHPSG